jgi:hypothetical protein
MQNFSLALYVRLELLNTASYSMVKSERFLSKIGNKTRMFILAASIQHSTRSLCRTSKQEKEIKGQMIFNKLAKVTQWGRDHLFNK